MKPKRQRKPAEKPVVFWRALDGVGIIEAGTKRNGKPDAHLVTRYIVAHTKSAAKAITKAHPHIKFVECTR